MEFTTALNEFVASPVTTRARAQSFNLLFANGDISANLMAGFSNNQTVNQPIIHNARRNSLPGPSKMNALPKRNVGSRVSSRLNTSNGMPSPTETDPTPTLKHLNTFVQSSSIEYDIDGFVEEMRREKHNNMLLAEDSMSTSDSDVDEKADTKKPNAGARRPTGAGRTPANWIPPTPGLVEVPATRLRNRQQKERERLASESKANAVTSTTGSEPPAHETVCISLFVSYSRLPNPRHRVWRHPKSICLTSLPWKIPPLLAAAAPQSVKTNRHPLIPAPTPNPSKNPPWRNKPSSLPSPSASKTVVVAPQQTHPKLTSQQPPI